MKAKIVPKQQIALLYNPERAKNGEKLTALLESMQIDYRIVAEEQLSYTVGQLAGYQPVGEQPLAEHQPPEGPAMAMGGFVGKSLDSLLNAMMREGIELPVKMVITPHNEGWAFGKLIEEVSNEHALFMEMERLKKLSDRADKLLEREENESLRSLSKQARDLLSRMRLRDDRQPTREELCCAADQLEELLKTK